MHMYRGVAETQVAVKRAVRLGRGGERTEADEVTFLVAREFRAVMNERRERPLFVFGLRDERPVRAYEKHPSPCVDFYEKSNADKGSVVVYADAENLRPRLLVMPSPFPRLQKTVRLQISQKTLPGRFVPYRFYMVGVAAFGRKPLIDVRRDRCGLFCRYIHVSRQVDHHAGGFFRMRTLSAIVGAVQITLGSHGRVVPDVPHVHMSQSQVLDEYIPLVMDDRETQIRGARDQPHIALKLQPPVYFFRIYLRDYRTMLRGLLKC